METEDSILPYVKAENGVPGDQQEIYPEESQKYKRENKRICELCKQTCTHNSTPVKDLESGLTCNIPDVDFTSTKEPVVCSSCVKSLETHRGSLENSLNVQDKSTSIFERKEGPCFIKMEEIEMKSEENHIGNTPEFVDDPRPGQTTQNHQTPLETLPDQAESTRRRAALEGLRHLCDECDYGTNYKNNFNRHLLKHKKASEVQMYKCNNCNFQTKYKECLADHQLTHKDISQVRMYMCGKCGHKTKYKAALARHVLTHKDASEVQMYKCNECDYTTKHRRYLAQHQLGHRAISEAQMYKCNSCKYKTKIERNFTRHKLTHSSDAQMYKCDECSYETKHKSYFARHREVHGGGAEGPMYKCDICNFLTKIKANLYSHQLVHREDFEVQMFKCDSCDFQTKHRCNLSRHRLLHKDDCEVQMYKCGSCDFETKFKRRLVLHISKKHKSKDLQEGTFTEKDNNGGCSKEVEPFDLKATDMVTEDIAYPYIKSENEIPLDQPEFYLMDTDTEHLTTETGISESKEGPISIKVEAIDIKSEENEVLDVPGCDDGPCVGETSEIRQETNETPPVHHKPARQGTSRFNCRPLRHKNVSETPMYKCDKCEHETSDGKNFKRHALVHDLNAPVYKCAKCNFQTKHKGSMVQHQLVHRDVSEVQMYKCDRCGYETKYKTRLVAHMQSARHISISKELEEGTFPEKHEQASRAARKDDIGAQIYKCECCDYQTSHKPNLLRHQLLHKDGAEVQMYKCCKCSFQTKHKKSLAEHQLVHKDVAEVQTFKCESCNFETKYKKNIVAHVQSAKHKSISKVQRDSVSGK